MLKTIKESIEAFFLLFLTTILSLLFLISTPISNDPHCLLVMNETSDLSTDIFIKWALFGSAAICTLLGSVVMSGFNFISAGIISNLMSTTYILLWIDSVFELSVQYQTFNFLICFGLGYFFIYMFFFIMRYINTREEPTPEKGGWKEKIIQYWLLGWVGFYFVISTVLIFKSVKYSEPQVPLAICFLGGSFFNYLFLMFFKKQIGIEIENVSKLGRWLFSGLFFIIIFIGIKQAWFH